MASDTPSSEMICSEELYLLTVLTFAGIVKCFRTWNTAVTGF